MKYFSKLGVGEFYIEAQGFSAGDRLLVIGPTTGIIYLTAGEIRYDMRPVDHAEKGWSISLPVPAKIRPSDKLYKLVATEPDDLPPLG